MEKITGGEKKYLSCAELSDGMTAERHAYLIKITRRVDRNCSPYLTFHLKTIDRTIIIGHKFRVSEDDSTGINILTYNRMMVRVKFEVQIYNGAYTLHIKEISLLPKEDSSPFFDVYERAVTDFDLLNGLALERGLNSLNLGMKTAGLFSIRYGLVGAYLELLSTVYGVITARQSEHTDKLVTCLLALSNSYFQYLQLVEKLDFLPKKEVLSILQSIVVEADEDLTSVVVDILSALMKQGSPEHLYAHIVCAAFETAERRFILEDMVKTSPSNLVMKVDEGRLIYY